MKWVVFFSQTGSEILSIIKIINKEPDLIITNNKNYKSLKIYKLYSHKIIFLDKYQKIFNLINKDTLITLHGYLKIIPAKFCIYDIYNLHPGLISKYPELKGIDPQKRISNYPTIGCVLHKVIPEVDSGEIILQKETFNRYDFNKNLKVLKEISLELWIEFLSMKF